MIKVMDGDIVVGAFELRAADRLARLRFKEVSCVVLTNLEFKFSHSSFQLEQLHVKGSLFASESSHLLLDARILSFLVSVVAFHFLFHLEVLIGESLPDFLSLQSEHALQGLFFATEHLHFLLVVVELFCQRLDHVLEGD